MTDTPTAHPINPETERLFEKSFRTCSVLVDRGEVKYFAYLDNWGRMCPYKNEEILQFIADREHEAEKRGEKSGLKEAYDIIGEVPGWQKEGSYKSNLRNAVYKALTDKESHE